MDIDTYMVELRRLQAELDIVTRECNEWKEKFERMLVWKKQASTPIVSIRVV